MEWIYLFFSPFMYRDLAIKRMFDDNPVLWDVLEIISRGKLKFPLKKSMNPIF